jgi:hypothetical protein
MKRVFVFVTSLTFFTVAGGQVTQQYIQDPSQVGKVLEANTGLDISGSPYLIDAWRAGLASLTKDGAQFKFSKMRYNVLKEQVEFENNGKGMFLDPAMFSQFMIIQGSDTLVFRNKIEGIKSITPLAYVQVSYEGKNRWLIKPIKTLMNDPEATYGSTKKKVIQSDESFYLVKASKEVVPFKMNARAISKSTGVPQKSLTDFLGAAGLSLDNPAHYKTIFRWLDSQIQ